MSYYMSNDTNEGFGTNFKLNGRLVCFALAHVSG